jgi:triphosphatase
MSDHDTRPAGPPVKAAPIPWSGKELRAMDGQALLRHMIRACLDQVRPNADAVAQDSADPAHVHQLRVGLRRLRTALRAMRPFGGGLPPDWESTLRPVFDALGEARDRHVLATTLAPRLGAAGAPLADLPAPSAALRAAPGRLVRGARFRDLLRALQAFAETPAARIPGSAGEGLEHLVDRLRRLARQVRRGTRRFESLSFERRHRLRKRLKRLRYLAEFAAPAFGRADAKAWMKAASRAQDALGRHVDRSLAARRFAALAATDPRAWFAAGWLRAGQARSARAAGRALARLDAVDRFW